MYDLVVEYLNDFEIPARIYTLLSVICLVLDLISCLVFLILTGQDEDKVIHGSKLFFVSMYFYMDLIYIAYVIHFVLKLPSSTRMYTAKALFGFGSEMRVEFQQVTGSSNIAKPAI